MAKKSFPTSLFLQVSNWVNDASESDKTQLKPPTPHPLKNKTVTVLVNPFSKHFIGLIENKVSCINKHTIYTSIT